MISLLQGTLIRKSPVSIVVDVNGVGYQVHVSLPTYYSLPDLRKPVTLNIHTHVREDEFKLFGFASDLEQRVFEKLIGISKVGPKLALTILSGMSVGDFLAAVSSKDIVRLSAIPGVGAKTAERLTLEMKDKLRDLSLDSISSIPCSPSNPNFEDALSALINLGYKKPQAEKALKTVYDKVEGKIDLEELIKNALKLLS